MGAADRRMTAVVTGASGGIGRGIALHLARAGWDVVIGWARDEEGAEATAAEVLAAGSRTACVQGDVSERRTAEALADAALGVGRLDVWVNNAGVSTLAPVLCTTEADMRRMIEVNVMGVFHGLQVAGAVMANQGSGRIVNVASDLGLQAAPLLAGYSATKFAVVGLTQAAAVELAPHGVAVNAVCPGTVETRMVLAEEESEARIKGASVEDVRRRLRAAVPAGRLCTAEDVGRLVTWLASEAAAYITGQAICTNGGSILH